ncbi:MAG TPA: tRNA (adenosine(37)-N6)-dimethylallyltransferase MiaA, partial [Flavisolibacter sp.]|nr:tRNA (adenosine(37)-N6)-dimethylallyltransferase MiaA [Flavisolibacter sp.]
MKKEKTVIIIAGPTAVGKTAVGIAVAKHFGAEIISADSRQCYAEMNIGVARPSPDELADVPHHFIASHSIRQKVTAATFEEYALAKAEELFQKHDTIVMVGGTGLYIKAFAEGMDQIPAVPSEIHKAVVQGYHDRGLAWLQQEVKNLDPQFYQRGEIQNPQRTMRALEVVKATGQSIFSFHSGEKKQREFGVIKIALELPKEQLHQNINHRVDKMMELGLLEEVRSLLLYQHLN